MRKRKSPLPAGSLHFLMAVAAVDPSWFSGIPGQSIAIGLDSTNYLFQKSTVPNQSFNTIAVQASARNSSPRVRLGGQAQAFYTVGTSLPFNFEVNEAYIGTARSLSWGEFTFGRQIKPWSELDDAWKLGVWQPRFFYDPFQATPSGLIGAFFDTQIGNVRLTVMGSGISFPEHGLLTAFDNGKVVSPSRWFRTVPESLPMFGAGVPVNYTLSSPDIVKMLFNPSGAIRARVGGEYGFWGAAAYSYKPVNQIQMGMDGYLDINSSLQVTLYPRTVYHHVGTVETGFQSRQWSATLSGLAEIPVSDSTPESWTTQRLAPALAGGPLVRYSPQGVGRAPRLLMGYLLQRGGDAPDQGALADPNQTAFDRRYFFQNALLLDGEIDVATRWLREAMGAPGIQILARAKVLTDFAYGAVMLSPQIQVRFRDSVAVGIGADLFATAAQGFAQAGFLGQSVQNSRLYGRVSYGF